MNSADSNISRRRLRVLKLSHTAALKTYRARERVFVSRHPVDLVVVTTKDWPHLGAEPDLLQESFPIYGSRSYLSGNVPLFAYDTSEFAQALKQHKPDIVDLHQEPYSVSGFQGAWLACQLAPQAKRLFCTAQNIQKKYPAPFRWTEQFVYRKCAAAYMCCKEAEQVLRRKGYRGITEIFPLGVDTTVFRPDVTSDSEKSDLRQIHKIPDRFTVGYFGRIESYKGVQLIVEALALICSTGREAQLVIAGNGPYENEVRTLSQQRGVSDRVLFLGALNAGDIPKFLSLCSVIAVPSLTKTNWKEQFGRVPVEAMACGIPVISSDSGSLPEVVAGTGLIVPENDVEALTAAIMRLMDDQELRKELSENGLQRVQREFTWEVIADRTYDLYQRILNQDLAKSTS